MKLPPFYTYAFPFLSSFHADPDSIWSCENLPCTWQGSIYLVTCSEKRHFVQQWKCDLWPKRWLLRHLWSSNLRYSILEFIFQWDFYMLVDCDHYQDEESPKKGFVSYLNWSLLCRGLLTFNLPFFWKKANATEFTKS